MKISTALTAAALVARVLARAPFSPNRIRSRRAKALMKENNDNAKVVVQMMRGQQPFDPKAVEAAFAQWADTAQKLPGLFPDNSKTGEDNARLAENLGGQEGLRRKGRRLRQGRRRQPRQGGGLARRLEGRDRRCRQGLRQLPRGLPAVPALDNNRAFLTRRRDFVAAAFYF